MQYIFQGNARIWFVPSIADPTLSPEVAEIEGGDELTDVTSEVNGFDFTTSRVEVPTAGSRFTPTIPGVQKSADSSLRIYMDSIDNPLRATLALDTAGYVVIRQGLGSDVPVADGDVVDVFPVIVAGRPKRRQLGDNAADWELQLSISAVPAEDIEVGGSS